ncbi:leucine-rich repeat extensin-like protein 3 [Selaginella moellendorffii]|nr:leucine-rich repeat extensin-like protein 3 [Selaginella moellendorffii]|eukprot:XP_024529369.1 leucine-rich repeat extensin-like protein 3 [Selaginella moellendorffii]
MAAFYKLAILVLLVCLDATADARKWSPKKPPAVPPMVFGAIFCDRCMDKTFSFATIAIPNVTAIIRCGDFQASNTTSEFGVFTIALPLEVGTSPAKLASCSVKVASDFSRVEGDLGTCNTPVKFQFQPWSPPSPPSMPAFQSSLKIARPWPFYSAGPFFFQPPEPLPSCNENPFRHPKPAVADDQGSSAAPPPHPAFPGFGNFPPFFPGAIPPVDHSTANKAAPPHPVFGYPPFAFPPPSPKPEPHGSNKAAPPPHSTPFPGFAWFPGAFPPHPSSSKPGSAPPKHGSPSAQAPPPFHGTKKHHHQ